MQRILLEAVNALVKEVDIISATFFQFSEINIFSSPLEMAS